MRLKRPSMGGVMAMAVAIAVAATGFAHRGGGEPLEESAPVYGAPQTPPGATQPDTRPADLALFPDPGEDPALQRARLQSWFANGVADVRNGRPVLASEIAFCDFRSVIPEQSSPLPMAFGSNGPLDSELTPATFFDGCMSESIQVSGDGRNQILSPASLRDRVGSQPSYTVCAAPLRGPIQRLADASVPVTLLKPVVVVGSTCANQGYTAASPDVLATWNELRDFEVAIRAIPRECPTAEEASAWVRLASASGGRPLVPFAQVLPSDASNRCWYHLTFDWDAGTVGIA